MTALTEAERETLRTPCACGHSPNEHHCQHCWIGDDSDADAGCVVTFEELLAERLAPIVDGRVRAALAPIEALAEGYDDTSGGGWRVARDIRIALAAAATTPPGVRAGREGL